jgi:adenine-specific DNA-methyltransferase
LGDITWRKLTAAKAQSGFFSNVKDGIYVFSKTQKYCFNPQFIEGEKDDKNYSYIEEKTGRQYGSFDFTQKGSGPARMFGKKKLEPPAGKHWIWDQDNIDQGMKDGKIFFTSSGLPRVKRYLDEKEGNYLGDLWADDEVAPLSANSAERADYDTQKPEALLQRIIQASSNPGDIVADFFCGSGTTLATAEKLGRRWVGSDLSKFAIQVTRKRLLGIHESKTLNQ